MLQITRQNYKIPVRDFVNMKELAGKSVDDMQELMPELNDYASVHYLINHESFPLPKDVQNKIY